MPTLLRLKLYKTRLGSLRLKLQPRIQLRLLNRPDFNAVVDTVNGLCKSPLRCRNLMRGKEANHLVPLFLCAERPRSLHHLGPRRDRKLSLHLLPVLPDILPGLAAGLAVREAVRQVTSLEADIRWPNDLLFGKKKFCGILTELNAEVTRVRHAAVGIGINVHQESFPDPLGLIASSLRCETGRSWARQDLLIALLQSLYREAQALSAETAGAAANILSRLERASTWIRGRQVHVDEGSGYSGVTAGLDARGFLRVRTAEGLRTVHSGGVRDQ